ncbi:MAG: pseudouridine synthase [Planctomycetota bacterium]
MNQLLAAAGYGSRRHVEDLIREGRVSIDGVTVVKLGVQVDPNEQEIRVDGVVWRPQKLVYYAVHKPTGVVTTNSDPHGRPRVIDLVPPSERVFPVGRLDRSSEGLILLTNDGDLAQKLAHPKYAIQKVYRVTVAGKVDADALRQMRQGIYIAEGLVRVDGARVLKAKSRATEMEIRLREGKNREIRRILARLGHKVQTLRRIAIGPLRLGDMPAAAYRKLTQDEVRRLHDAADRAANQLDRGRSEDEAPGTATRRSRGGKRASGNPSGQPRSSRSRTGASSTRGNLTGHQGTPKSSRRKAAKKPTRRSASPHSATSAKGRNAKANTTKSSFRLDKPTGKSDSGVVIGGDEPMTLKKTKRVGGRGGVQQVRRSGTKKRVRKRDDGASGSRRSPR